MHSNVTIKNVSWPHFSWPTLYIVSLVNPRGLEWLYFLTIKWKKKHKIIKLRNWILHICCSYDHNTTDQTISSPVICLLLYHAHSMEIMSDFEHVYNKDTSLMNEMITNWVHGSIYLSYISPYKSTNLGTFSPWKLGVNLYVSLKICSQLSP